MSGLPAKLHRRSPHKYHSTSTIEEIISALSGATIFSPPNFNKGYYQVELSDKSHQLTTFATQKGLKDYMQLVLGLSSAALTFHCIIHR